MEAAPQRALPYPRANDGFRETRQRVNFARQLAISSGRNLIEQSNLRGGPKSVTVRHLRWLFNFVVAFGSFDFFILKTQGKACSAHLRSIVASSSRQPEQLRPGHW